MFFCCCGFYFDTIDNHIGPEGNVLPACRYGEGADWFSFDYEGFWCSSSSASLIWSLLNEVLCADVIECRTAARSCRNLTLALSVTYHFCCGLGQITYPLCVSVLVGVQDMVPVKALGDWGFRSSQPVSRMLRPVTAPLLHLCCSAAFPNCSVTHGGALGAVVFSQVFL